MTYNVDSWPYIQRCKRPSLDKAGVIYCDVHQAYIDHAQKYAATAAHSPSCACDFCAEAHEAYQELLTTHKLDHIEKPHMPRRMP